MGGEGGGFVHDSQQSQSGINRRVKTLNMSYIWVNQQQNEVHYLQIQLNLILFIILMDKYWYIVCEMQEKERAIKD